MLLATCCEDDVVPHVLPFIKEHIKNIDWRYRDASVMAFGSILEGPELNQLKPLVIQVSHDLNRLELLATRRRDRLKPLATLRRDRSSSYPRTA